MAVQNLHGAQEQPAEVVGEVGDVTELAPGLSVLGGWLKLDGRISWAAPDAWGTYSPLNCYVLQEGDGALVIDPGPVCHRDLVLEQLVGFLPLETPISVYLTRPEFDTFGALGTLSRRYRIQGLHASGGANPFDAFDYLAKVDPATSPDAKLERVAVGPDRTMGPKQGLEIIAPSIRLLVTYWVYDAALETLFTSDAFSHGTSADPTTSRVISDTGEYDVEAVRSHLFQKFWWMPHAGENARGLLSDMRSLFDRHSIKTIAPSRGRIIQGPAAVEEHFSLVERVLSDIEEQA